MDDGSWQALAAHQFERIGVELAGLLEGIEDTRLDEPAPGFPNPLGWTAWHISRNIDRNCSELTGRVQAWSTWAERFGRAADPADTGFGHTPDQVAAFRSTSTDQLLAYHSAAQAVAREYLDSAPDDDGTRLVVSPTLGNTYPVVVRLARTQYDAIAHLGQMSVLRHLG